MRGLTFITLFEKLSNSTSVMMVDINGFVSGITRGFLEKLGFNQIEIDQVCIKTLQFRLKVEYLMPDFCRLIES